VLQSKGRIDYAPITPSYARTLSKKLDANVLINGSIKQAGTTIHIIVQLIDSKTGAVLKYFHTEGLSKEEEILQIIDSLSALVKNFLVISNNYSKI
jgi:TolB-like protein